MTDYKEEQNNEIEALQSIYHDTFEEISSDPPTYRLMVETDNENEELSALAVKVRFTYTQIYPDEAVQYEVEETTGLEDSHMAEICDLINTQAEENLGMAMVFTIISSLKEYLNDLQEKFRLEEEKEKERQEMERKKEEEKIFHGTPVTLETFLVWKQKFDREFPDMKKEQKSDVKDSKKLTGKQLFLTNDNLHLDELLEGESESVAVDESLFKDLDDLDLDDEDDPDYVP